MFETSLYTLGSVFLVSAMSLIGIITVFWNEERIKRHTHLLVSLAIGALLGGAFIHLIPESFHELGDAAGIVILAGILLFFVFEKVLHWHHEHFLDAAISNGDPAPERLHPVGVMLIVSDGIHNLLDGVIIGASYLVSVEIGIATTIAVVLHEIPQEIGDFGVLLHAGYSRALALTLNFLSALTSIVGAVLVLVLNETAESAVAWVVPLAAGGFIYIAASDLIPELHKFPHVRQSIIQLFVIILGVAMMLLIAFLDTGHGYDEVDEYVSLPSTLPGGGQ